MLAAGLVAAEEAAVPLVEAVVAAAGAVVAAAAAVVGAPAAVVAAGLVAAGAGVEVALPPQAASTAGMMSERSANDVMRRHDRSFGFGLVPMFPPDNPSL